jgi:hypothetical protein
MTRYFILKSSLLLISLLLAACNISTPNITPTSEILISETPTVQPSPTMSPSPTSAVTATRTPTPGFTEVAVVVATAIPTESGLPAPDAPETTPEATAIPGCEATIQEGESLTQALFRVSCNNEITNGLIEAVVAYNDNIVNANIVNAGTTFIVPPPTATPIPPGADMTETAAAERGVRIIGNQQFAAGQEFGCYEIQEGDSAVEIAQLYNTSLEVLSQQNQNLNWSGCNFTIPSGGPECNPNLRIGACVTVPLPTSTPVPTSTPSGNETATPTPTFRAARSINPPDGALASAGRLALQWVSTGILKAEDVYLVEIADRTTGTTEAFRTRQTFFRLPETLIPSDGQTHTIQWRVSVARPNADGTYSRIGAAGEWHTFQWESR